MYRLYYTTFGTEYLYAMPFDTFAAADAERAWLLSHGYVAAARVVPA